MKRYIRSATGPKTLDQVYSYDDKCYVNLIYDVWGPGGSGPQRYQEQLDPMPISEALDQFGDWMYSGAYTTEFEISPDGKENWYVQDVWIYTTDHPEVTHIDELEVIGPIGKIYRRLHKDDLN